MSSIAYMTPDAKAKEMAEFRKRRKEHRPGGHLAGLGHPDLDILPYCDEINELSGMCTLQSCAGHGAHRSQGTYVGNLWLWMDAATSAAMDAQAMVLEGSPLIESVSKLYRSGRVVWDLSFQGNNHEPGRLEDSMRVLLPFLRALRSRPSPSDAERVMREALERALVNVRNHNIFPERRSAHSTAAQEQIAAALGLSGKDEDAKTDV